VPLDPIKLCCGRRASEHRGVQCPDGKVMCCHCFGRFTVAELYTYPGDDVPSDVCVACAAKDRVGRHYIREA
jgi:hypothetical protein